MISRPRARFFLLTICLSLLVIGGIILGEGIGTLRQLTVVEQERDTWQKPAAVIQALDLHPGNAAEDLGSGAGYFTLKLARTVGDRGVVVALDLRTISLAFLWIRAHQQGLHAIRVIHGDAVDPAMYPREALDGVLIANTYHEMTQPQLVLESVRRSLRPGGRLVIVDRGPESASDHAWQSDAEQHEVPLELVDRALRQVGYEVLSENGHFIDAGPGADHWWLIVAMNPEYPAIMQR